MASLADVYRALNEMQEEGTVEKYAVGGGMAALFYAETTRTYDVDVFVMIETPGIVVDLSRIYNWARAREYEVRDEYLIIHGVPVQILVAGKGLQTEAVETANVLEYDGFAVTVMQPVSRPTLCLRRWSQTKSTSVRTDGRGWNRSRTITTHPAAPQHAHRLEA